MCKAAKLDGVSLHTRGHPLETGPRKEFIPDGMIPLTEARERLGRALFPGTWTGKECAGPFEGTWGRTFRSKSELEADRAYHEAKFRREYEAAGRAMPKCDDEDGSSHQYGDLPPLSSEALEEIEAECMSCPIFLSPSHSASSPET